MICNIISGYINFVIPNKSHQQDPSHVGPAFLGVDLRGLTHDLLIGLHHGGKVFDLPFLDVQVQRKSLDGISYVVLEAYEGGLELWYLVDVILFFKHQGAQIQGQLIPLLKKGEVLGVNLPQSVILNIVCRGAVHALLDGVKLSDADVGRDGVVAPRHLNDIGFLDIPGRAYDPSQNSYHYGDPHADDTNERIGVQFHLVHMNLFVVNNMALSV